MFYEISKMVSIYFLPEFDTKNINDMFYIFSGCYNLVNANLHFLILQVL